MAYAWLEDKGFNASLMKSSNIHLKVGPVVGRYADLIKNRITTSMAATKHGLPWKSKTGSGKASAPGEPPAIRIGKLVGSIQIKMTSLGMEAEVGSFGVGYAKELEKGIGVAARPFVQPAFDQYRDGFVNAVRRAVMTI